MCWWYETVPWCHDTATTDAPDIISARITIRSLGSTIRGDEVVSVTTAGWLGIENAVKREMILMYSD